MLPAQYSPVYAGYYPFPLSVCRFSCRFWLPGLLGNLIYWPVFYLLFFKALAMKKGTSSKAYQSLLLIFALFTILVGFLFAIITFRPVAVI